MLVNSGWQDIIGRDATTSNRRPGNIEQHIIGLNDHIGQVVRLQLT
jgi:hypothetical protein